MSKFSLQKAKKQITVVNNSSHDIIAIISSDPHGQHVSGFSLGVGLQNGANGSVDYVRKDIVYTMKNVPTHTSAVIAISTNQCYLTVCRKEGSHYAVLVCSDLLKKGREIIFTNALLNNSLTVQGQDFLDRFLPSAEVASQRPLSELPQTSFEH